MNKIEKAMKEQSKAIGDALSKRKEAEGMAYRLYSEILEPINKIYREEISVAESVLREAIR